MCPLQHVNRCIFPNDGDGYYVSYNFADRLHYGCATTALVLGQMAHFYILNGNHLGEYEKIIDQGFGACMSYFQAHIKEINHCSERAARFKTGDIVRIQDNFRHDSHAALDRQLRCFIGKTARVTSQIPTYKINDFRYSLDIDQGRETWNENKLELVSGHDLVLR